MTPTDDQDDPRVTDDEQERRNIRDWLKAQPPTGSMSFTLRTPASTVQALREYTLHVDSTLKDDYDRCEKKLKKLSSRHLVFVETDPENACVELEITPGRLKMKTLAQAAKLIRERRDRYWTMGLTASGSLIVAIIAAWITAKMTVSGMM